MTQEDHIRANEYIDPLDPTLHIEREHNSSFGVLLGFLASNGFDFWHRDAVGNWWLNQTHRQPKERNEALNRAFRRALRKKADEVDPQTDQQ